MKEPRPQVKGDEDEARKGPLDLRIVLPCFKVDECYHAIWREIRADDALNNYGTNNCTQSYVINL